MCRSLQPSWKKPWPFHSGGNPAGIFQPALFFTLSTLNQSHSSSMSYSHSLAEVHAALFLCPSLWRTAFPAQDSCILCFPALAVRTGEPQQPFQLEASRQGFWENWSNMPGSETAKGPWINEAEGGSFPTISISPRQKCQTPALLAQCIRTVYVLL